MKIKMYNGLPTLSINLSYNTRSITVDQVLIDTGCMISIFDTDLMDEIGLYIVSNSGKTVRMYGVGGQSELCFQQSISGLVVENRMLNDFDIQLGMTKEPYGFDAILGVDFFIKMNLKIDFENFNIY
jgi:hypothetical protein